MGSGSSREQQIEQILKDYKQGENLKDPQYGDIQIMVNNISNEQVAIKEIILQQTEDEQQSTFEKLIKLLIKLQHPNLLKIINYTLLQEDHVCSSVTKLLWIMEYIKRDMGLEIRTRKLTSPNFMLQDIWSILIQSVNALSILQQNNIYHGDIRSQQMFVTSIPQLVVKFSVPQLMSVNNQFVQIMTGQKKSGCYLSPQLTEALQSQNWSPEFNKYKSDVFSLGMVILEITNMKPVDDCYNYGAGTIDWEKISSYLQSVRSKYGQQLYDVLQNMLEKDESKRSSFIELTSILNINSEEIGKNNTNFKEGANAQTDKNATQTNFNNNTLGMTSNLINTSAQPQNMYYTQQVNINSTLHPQQKLDIQQQQQQQPQSSQNIQQQNQSAQLQLQETSQQQQQQQVKRRGIKLHCDQTQTQAMNQKENKDYIVPKMQDIAINGNNMYKMPNTSNNLQNQQQLQLQQPQQQQQKLYPTQFVQQMNINKYKVPETNSSIQSPALTDIKTQSPCLAKDSQRELNASDQQLPQQQQQQEQQQQQQLLQQQIVQSAQASNNDSKPSLSSYQVKQSQSNIYNVYQADSDRNQKQTNYQNKLPNQNQISNSQHPVTLAQLQELYEPVQSSSQLNNNNYGMTHYESVVENRFTRNDAIRDQQINNLIQPDKITKIQSTKYQPGQFQSENIEQNSYYDELKYQPLAFQAENQNNAILRRSTTNQQQSQKHSPDKLPEKKIPIMNQIQIATNNIKLDKQQQGTSQPGKEEYQLSDEVQKIIEEYKNKLLIKPNQIVQEQDIQQKSPININQNIQSDSDKKAQQQYLSQEYILQDQSYQQQLQQSQSNQNLEQLKLQQENAIYSQKFENQNNAYKQLQKPPQNDQEQEGEQAIKNDHYEKLQETYEDGSIYDGEKVNGLRHGQGKFYYTDGGYYDGEWSQGKMEGYGTLYYPSGGLAYMGQWIDDKFNGKGTVFNEVPQKSDEEYDYSNFDSLGELWVKYEGEFVNDNKQGIGCLYLSNNEKYVGQFSNDLIHGQGTYYTKNSQIIKGIWDSNKLVEVFQ